ncbi:MAG: biotin--[acetyl-CoA-carboxylase] ligase [Ferruginibacter sp.]|nr:biotin--[acetyl-CoA-carboxylase] ligase [Ferruginibacter sp.]
MHHTGPSFVILEQVDSTNNYAMGKVHAGMAKHGDAWYSGNQTQGKGQRGKAWVTGQGYNIALSVVLNPKQLNIIHPFQLSAVVALAFFDFFVSYAGDETHIKWPNDIYWRDRKAGGVLIENKFSGKDWNWSVTGIGINVNQPRFDEGLTNAVSLLQITGKVFDTTALARELHQLVLKRCEELLTKSYELLLEEYNQHLYKKQQSVRLKKDNMVFKTLIKGVSPQGQLLTLDAIEKSFEFGEVEWVI